ncbi:MAG: Rrf2 family transcriptional regulator [Polyangiaceae bacterium]|jgi:Rrf2 family protein|nr:Rrf2 family transcriptional regulator [Polyangiaceae bacterium]
MKLSSQEEYGLRCLLQLARQGPDSTLTILELSVLEGLSQANVAKMMRLLRQGGFVCSARGQAGGYFLARPAADIAVGQVLATLGGRLFDAEFCKRHSPEQNRCNHEKDCSVRGVWELLQSALDQALNQLMLQDLLSSEVELLTRRAPVRGPTRIRGPAPVSAD